MTHFSQHEQGRRRASGATARAAAAVTAVTLGFSLVPRIASASPWVVRAAVAPSDDVDAIVAEAIEKFQAKDYAGAVELFERAYELSPEPNYLFNIGRVWEQAGELEKAVDYYGRFVKLPEVDLGAREVALERLRVLRGVIEETKAKEPEPEPEPESDPIDPVPEPEPEPDPGDEDEDDKPNGMRIGGFVLLGVGAATLGAGGAFGGLALQRNNELEDDLVTLEERDDARDRGKRNALAADIMFGLGGALLVTGVVLVALSYAKKDKGSRAAIAPTIARGGAGLAAEVRF